MPSDSAGAEGGGGGEKGGFLGNLYYLLEDKYYGLLDFLEEAGLHVYGLVDAFESRGIRTLPIALLLLLLLLLGGYWLFGMPHAAGETNFELTVFSGDKKIAKAVVQVFDGSELLASDQTGGEGVVSFESLPAKQLRFVVSAKGYEKSTKTFDLSGRSRASVELACAGANCLQPTPPPRIDLSTPTPIVVPSPTARPTVVPTASPEPPKPVSFTVQVLNRSGREPVHGAVVELRKSGISLLLGNLSADEAGLAVFDQIEFGTSVYLIVRAPGFVAYNGVVAKQTIALDKPGLKREVLLDTAVTIIQMLKTTFSLRDENGNPVRALVEFFVNDSATPFLTATVDGQGVFEFPAGSRITAVVFPPDATYAGSTVSFNAGEPAAGASLNKIDVIIETPSCEVFFPGSFDASSEVVAAPGQRVPVKISFSSRPSAPVSLLCGNIPAFASCTGTQCFTQCVFEGEGTRAVSAVSGNTSCSATRQISVQRITRSYSLAAAPGILQLGNKTTVLVRMVDAQNVQGQVTISCGNGQSVQADCGGEAGVCTAECGPYTTSGSKPILAIVGSDRVAATTVFVNDAAGCSLALSPASPVEQQSVDVFVSFNYSENAGEFTLECGPRSQTIPCSGKSGVCKASCSLDSPGSYAVVARSGGRPACGATAFVNPFQLSATASFCGDDSRTPAGACSNSTKPLFCTRQGKLESRASRCGCPQGWRVSPDSPDFCEKLSERKIIGFNTSTATLAAGKIFGGQVTGAAQVIGVRNNSASLFAIVDGVPVGAELLAALNGGSLVQAGVTGDGRISGASLVVGADSSGKPFAASVTNGRLPASAKKVLIVSAGSLAFKEVNSDGTISGASTISSVVGISGGSVELVTLDGGPAACADGTPVGLCSQEKPFSCSLRGVRSPDASKCGCPSGWRANPADSSQCSPQPATGLACGDGTPNNACSVSARGLTCENGLLKPKASKCGCAQGFVANQNDVCVGEPINSGGFDLVFPSECSDSTPRNSCSGFKPLFCNSQAELVFDAARCGCPAVGGKQFVAQGSSCVEAPPVACVDGRTSPGSCKAGDAPFFCGADGSSFSSKASACGCAVVNGVQWLADGERCIPPPSEFCPDGTTRRNSCSLPPPMFPR